ncbi:MAG: hypothetical protein CR972_04250 [Candidatus Moraniibacteriota bacterium]|nr:MAG: hypothetical protein CR972_04250 [Candidatus Moranbacteria bacterium]
MSSAFLRKKISFLFFSIFFFLCAQHVWAQPILDVSVSPQMVLLGGQAQYTVTVRNTDATDKGYNLSFHAVFDSDRTDPEGIVSFSSAEDENTGIIPSSIVTDESTGETTIEFVNVRDLAQNEEYTFTLTVDLSGDATWEAMDDITFDLTAELNEFPDGTGTSVTDSASDTSDVLPIALMRKSTLQSTHVEQATGTVDRVYQYAIEVQNNYVNDTDSVIVTDTLPDGIEFLGVKSGHSCTETRDPDTGITTIVCDLSTMTPGVNETIVFDAGIRYDYYGTDNGGTNRVHNDFTDPTTLGTPIPDKTGFVNHVELDAEYQGDAIDMQSRDTPVVAAYATVEKSQSITHGGNGDTINYTITYAASEYYDILDDDVDDNTASITIHDLLPDGQTFNNDASPAESSYISNANGTADIYWNSSVLNGMNHSADMTITFSADVNNQWNGGDTIVAADNMTNNVYSHGEWDDIVDTSRPNDVTNSESTAEFGMTTPLITKEVEDPANPGTWEKEVDAVVGDTLKFRVRFNTTDGATPTLGNVNLGDIVVTDWLPKGTAYNNDATMTYSNASDFLDPSSAYNDSPVTQTIGSLNGVEWNLGDISSGGWWQAEFTVDIVDNAEFFDGREVNNVWKMTGINTNGDAYSDRDSVKIHYTDPKLVLEKNVTGNTLLTPGDTVAYTVTIENTGTGMARDVLFHDTVAEYMDDTAPTVTSVSLEGNVLTQGTDYTVLWDTATRAFDIDFHDGVVNTNLNAGEIITIAYSTIVDNDAGAGRQFANIATVSYNTRADGTGRTTTGTADVADDNTDDATIGLPVPTMSKFGPATPITVGETTSYSIEVTVPQGQIIYWPTIRDVFAQDGVVSTGNATLTDVSGAPVTGASFATSAVPTTDTTGSNNTVFRWDLAQPIDNRGQATDYVFRLDFDVTYTGLEDDGTSWEFFVPTTTDQLSDTGHLDFANYPAAARTTNAHAESSAVATDVDQPLLNTQKTITSTGPYTTGSTVAYQIEITNDGQSTAYDVSFADVFPTELSNPTLVSVEHSVLGALASGTGFVENFATNPLTIDFAAGTSPTVLAPGESLTIQYTAVTNTDIGSGAAVSNTADADWTSSSNTTIPRRVYDDSPAESGYTDDTATATVNISKAIFEKTIISPTTGSVQIGDTVQYQLEVSVPAETVLYTPTMQDVIATDGVQCDMSSVVLTDVSGNPETTAQLSATPTINNSQPNPGTTIDFAFNGNIDNADSASPTGDTDYVFHVRYDCVVTGLDDANNWIWDPTVTNHTINNTATLNWNDGNESQSANDSANINVAQPHITTTKNFDVANVAGGDQITATVEITNDGNGTAYEYDGGIDFTDVMEAGLINPQITSFTHYTASNTATTLNDASDYTFTQTANGFTLEYNSNATDLAPGERLVLVYTVDVDPLIGAGATMQNSVDADYSSMDGSNADERQYDDTEILEDDADSATDSVTTASPTITKDTSIGSNTATIGDEFDYTITVNIPQNTTLYDADINDTIPDGLTVLGVTTTPNNIGTVTTTANPNGTTTVVWDVGDVSYNPIPQVILTIQVRVDDAFFDATLLDGLPISVDGDAQDVLTNNAQNQWSSSDGGPLNTVTTDFVDVTVTEPFSRITKTVDETIAGIGDTLEYTVTIDNDGTAPLQNVQWTDTLPDELFDAPTSPTLLSVMHSSQGALTEGTDFVSNFGANPMTIDFHSGLSSTILEGGESMTITYRAIVENTVVMGSNLTNATTFSGSSQTAGNPHGRIYTDNDSVNVLVASTGIGDFVWHDRDQDGVQDVDEEGIAGITVSLRDSAGNPVDDPLNPGTPYTVTTDVHGNYAFINLSAGDYRVHFDTGGAYAVTTQDAGGDDTIDSDVDATNFMTDIITLGHDTTDNSIDAGFITAQLSGRMWDDTDGDGVQDVGETGIANAVVHLLDGSGNPVDNPDNSGTSYVVVTDANGDYTFDGLLAGDYQVEFDAPTDRNFSPKDIGGDDTTDSDVNITTGRTDTISLVAGEHKTFIDAGMYITTVLGGRIWDDTDGDGVQDSDENGIANVTLNLLDDAGNPVDDPLNPGTPYVVTTDSDGNYLFKDLLPGSYRVATVLPHDHAFSPQDVGGDDTQDSDMDVSTGITDVITLSSGDTITDCDGGLYQKVRLGGTVWRDDERNGIRAPWEPRLSGATVELLDGTGTPVDDPLNLGTPYTITTDANGNYLFENLAPGAYQIRMTAPSGGTYEATDKDAGSDDALDSDVDPVTYTTDTIIAVSGTDNRTNDAGFYALYANIFDPPHADKIVSETGENEIAWAMVWINDGNMAATSMQVLDDVPAGTTYVAGSFTCEARGASVTTVCTYDVAENRVRWEGIIAPDMGATTEENALNEVVLTYRTTVLEGFDEVQNQAQAYWDADGNGEFGDDILRDQTPVLSNDPGTAAENDPTRWEKRAEAEGNSSIGNYIWHDKNSDGKQDKDEPGLKDIRVKLTWAGPDKKFGTSDDYVWRTETNKKGKYLFDNLPKGKYKVKVKEEDIRKYVQTYDPQGKMNNKATVKLGTNDHHTKADFGYNTQEMHLAKTGESVMSLVWHFISGSTE